MTRVAALFVQPDGIYASMPDVDPWPESRDARTYAGPLPVVAHPPCATWGRYAHKAGGLGNDGGCFAAALSAVRLWGGVLEHPVGSRAWQRFDMLPPAPDRAQDEFGGWTLPIEQWWWGHEAIKPTWLYIVGPQQTPPIPHGRWRRLRPLEHMSKRERAATPPAFARWLVELAASARAEARSA